MDSAIRTSHRCQKDLIIFDPYALPVNKFRPSAQIDSVLDLFFSEAFSVNDQKRPDYLFHSWNYPAIIAAFGIPAAA
ncbi:MAG: hypothetical protein COT73_07520 [Bdellovibrio sp. CG10_big_fil_rev_8_21_14_0_10_47_8]|nr:MAG: hypothetical protein COT73_07520 [Bdellovibrio sp. CG10_big_fil_rev_8_21_14_0_10_47_8]